MSVEVVPPGAINVHSADTDLLVRGSGDSFMSHHRTDYVLQLFLKVSENCPLRMCQDFSRVRLGRTCVLQAAT